MLKEELANLEFKCWATNGKHMEPPQWEDLLKKNPEWTQEDKDKAKKEIEITYCNPNGLKKYHDFIEHRRKHY